MHVGDSDLIRYLAGTLPKERQAAVQAHLEQCELCREVIDDLHEFGESSPIDSTTPLPPAARRQRDQIYQDALRGRVIPLSPLVTDPPAEEPYRLAADGLASDRPDVECLQEYFSESPELVLRLMHSRSDNQSWVQLVADDPNLAAHVLLRLPESGQELLTDSSGRADLPKLPGTTEGLLWEVKMPDVTFTLDSLQYDPEKTEYATETMLESDRHDRVRLHFEGKTEGKQLTLEFLNLVDIADTDHLKVLVVEGTQAHIEDTKGARTASVRLSGSTKALTIRLYKA